MSRSGARATHKNLKNAGRFGNVYENKGQDDNLPDTKEDFSAWLHAILRRNTRISQKSSALLPFSSLLRHREKRPFFAGISAAAVKTG
jgi:hypothetical protein